MLVTVFKTAPRRRRWPAVLGIAYLLALTAATPAMAQSGIWRLSGHIPGDVSGSRWMGHVDSSQQMNLAVVLPTANQAELDQLVSRLYDPNDPMYGHFLTPAEYTSEFGPSQADYDQVISYCKTHGLNITGTHSNRRIVDVAGPAEAVESAFSVSLSNYVDGRGNHFFAPDNEPGLPVSLLGKVSAIVGLDSATQLSSHALFLPVERDYAIPAASPNGSGEGGGLSPSDIRSVYSMTDVPETGTGQKLALFELDGYNTSDIQTYEQAYHITSVPVSNVLIDNYSGAASGGGQFEVTMDIELMMALDPGISGIVVYEGPNNGSGILDTYNRIAVDDTAKSVSTSWGEAEYHAGISFFDSESSIFEEMAAQGQSFFAASGDCGAYDNHTSLSVDDPAADPYVTGCGGTALSTGVGNTWASETTWCDPSNTSESAHGAGGGGGISSVWSLPAWQTGVGSSSTMRNVPDVCLDADPDTGYSCVVNGSWYFCGGTSASAPLWAAFMGLVNERRLANGSSYVGLANPGLYAIGKSVLYSTAFHDIDDGSNNLYYTATAGYDNATGWGSMIGDQLIADLATPGTVSVVAPGTPTNVTATAGNAQVALSWTAPSGATSYNIKRANSSRSAYNVIATNVLTPSYTDTGLTNGNTYYYEVQAANPAGVSAYSKSASAKPMPPLPGAPTGVFATAGNAQVALSWTSVANATEYLVKRATTSGGAFSNLKVVTGTSYTNTGLLNYHTYYYEVCAVDMTGDGPASSPVSATPELPVPAAPTKLTATLSKTSVSLKWTNPAYAASYTIERSPISGGPYTVLKSGVTKQPYVDTATTAGATYYYVVVAVNQTGSSAPSNEASATIPVSSSGSGTTGGTSSGSTGSGSGSSGTGTIGHGGETAGGSGPGGGGTNGPRTPGGPPTQ